MGLLPGLAKAWLIVLITVALVAITITFLEKI